MAIKRITWRIVLSGESYVDIHKNTKDLERKAAERLGEIIDHEGIPDWTGMDVEITSVSDVDET